MEDDPELAALRSKRMAELQQQMGGGGNPEQAKQREEAARREDDMKNAMLTQILDQSARARLNSIALVKPDKARMVESMLIQMAQQGQIGGKLDEAQLKSLIERVNIQTGKKPKVTISRRKYATDSDDEDY